jgi:uncharacterized membrane protein
VFKERGVVAGSSVRLTAVTAIMTALVTLTTYIVQIPIPATKGVFNIGDSMVYVSALLFGAYAGAFAGGVGSMLSDVLGGYLLYAPATLVIKGAEGAIVGLLSQRLTQRRSKGKDHRTLTLTFFSVATFLILVMANLLSVLYFAGSGVLPSWLTDIVADPVFWIGFSLLVVLVIGLLASYAVYKSDLIILFMLLGGAVMVTGYFLYELVLVGIAAVVEVPINIMQVISGIAIARPIYRGVSRAAVS